MSSDFEPHGMEATNVDDSFEYGRSVATPVFDKIAKEDLERDRAAREQFEKAMASVVDIHSAARIENSLMEQDIVEALQDLPERCGLIFRMHRFEGVSQKQIAKELGISVKTVGNQIQRAVGILYKKLKHHIE